MESSPINQAGFCWHRACQGDSNLFPWMSTAFDNDLSRSRVSKEIAGTGACEPEGPHRQRRSSVSVTERLELTMLRLALGPPVRRWAVAAVALIGAVAIQVPNAVPASAAGSSVALFAWGDNTAGELGDGTTISTSTPQPVALPAGVSPTAFAGSGGNGDPQPTFYAGYAIGSDGNLYSWGDNGGGELGNGAIGGTSASPVIVSLPAGVTPTAIAAGQGLGYAIGSDGHEYAWGANPYGALGNGTVSNNSATPVVVSLPSGVTPTAIAAGYETGYAIGSDGNLYAWGDDFYGELGNGSGPNSLTPVLVPLPSGVSARSVSAGAGTGYAIGSDGNLYAWGLNGSGQLGDGTTAPSAAAGCGGHALGGQGRHRVRRWRIRLRHRFGRP